ncbi:MAG TPA: hypothetical protein VGN33_04705 [Leifsonia sp.]|jgi:hypothetical protein|nr:hypothetical protein [Leifsonia sp.]
MNVTLLSLLQGVGTVTLAVVAFTVALTWPALTPALGALRSERSKMLSFCGLALALLLGATTLYVIPGILLKDGSDAPIAIMLGAMWTIAVAALTIRGLLLKGVARAVTLAFAVVAATGLITGFVAAVYVEHHLADTITPMGAFLLIVAAVAGIVFWSNTDAPVARRA